MTERGSGAPSFLLRFSPTRKELLVFWRASAARQQQGAGTKRAWMSYLGAFPVGIIGGLVATGFGVDGRRFGALISVLVCLGYLAGLYALMIVGRLHKQRLAATSLRNFPDLYGERTIRIAQDGFEHTGEPYRAFWSWRHVNALTCHDDLLIFWIGIAQGIFVPRRVLSEAEEKGLLALAAQHLGTKT